MIKYAYYDVVRKELPFWRLFTLYNNKINECGKLNITNPDFVVIFEE